VGDKPEDISDIQRLLGMEVEKSIKNVVGHKFQISRAQH